MAGGKERVLRRRIGSVQNTKKITRAMELIAATRVVKAQQRARAARPYAEQITAVIENLAAGGADVDHPLLRQAEKVERVGVIVISSDRASLDRTTRRLSRPPNARCRTPVPRAPTTR